MVRPGRPEIPLYFPLAGRLTSAERKLLTLGVGTLPLHFSSDPRLASRKDRTLLQRARQGEVAAFEALIQPHVAAVRRFAYSFCGNWADADDLAQEALVKAFRSIASFRGDAAVATWLYTVVRSACVDWRRSRQAKNRANEAALGDGLSDSRDAQDVLLAKKDDAEQLWAAIRLLDPRFRVPVVLCDIEGMDYEQIAAIERVPVGTVRSRISRGRRQLRDLLTESAEQLAAGSEPGTRSTSASSNHRSRPNS